MELTLYQVDAFADDVFKGNPAAIVPLEAWLPTEMLQAIALENNLSETAYFVATTDGLAGHYDLRWFTPGAEVQLCGHATLASAYVLFEYLGEAAAALTFHTLSGPLVVTRGEGDLLSMDFPARPPKETSDDAAMVDRFAKALDQPIESIAMSGEYSLIVLASETQVHAVTYSGAIADALSASPFWGLLITAPADSSSDYDFVSRFFAPAKGVPEDPVTGSAHCMLAPYWAARLGKDQVVGYQASPRGGMVWCAMRGDRVTLSGRVAPYLKGTISIPV